VKAACSSAKCCSRNLSQPAVEEDVVADIESPQRLDAEFLDAALPAFQTQAASCAHEAQLAEFMIAKVESQPLAESLAQFMDAEFSAFHCGAVTEADGGRVAGIVAIGDDVIDFGDVGDEAVKLPVLTKRVTQPDVFAIEAQCKPEKWICYDASFVIITFSLLARAGVMDVTQDGDFDEPAH
jgi:hypothetical protein